MSIAEKWDLNAIELARPPVLDLISGGKLTSLSDISKFCESLPPEELAAINSDPSLWRLPYQRMPIGSWRWWIALMGRGTGKTFTGATMTNEIAMDRAKIRRGEIGLIARTWSDARFTMVEGPSGILATAPSNFRPTWEPGNGILRWPNQVIGRIFSADKPSSLRGPNWAWLWLDEFCHWPDAENTFVEVIEPALRLGWARGMITSTPRPSKFMRDLLKDKDSTVSRASTLQNPYLPEVVRQKLIDRLGHTRIGRQELLGELLSDNERALWKAANIEEYRVRQAPDRLAKVVVSIDPAVTAKENSDETGIVVAAADYDGHGYILADKTGIYTPRQWARRAIACYHRFRADHIVAEVNNGGDLVAANIHAEDPNVPVVEVRASRGKVTRAEPVAAMYERGRIHHVGQFPELEDQQVNWDPSSSESPDRIDATVWGLYDLLLDDQTPGPIEAYL